MDDAKLFFFSILFLAIHEKASSVLHNGGILYPRNTETRQVTSLDGIWDFIAPQRNNLLQGFTDEWFKTDLRQLEEEQVHSMPVPSSYNDITTDPLIRDHVGLVWYSRKFFAPKHWHDRFTRVWLRFGSVSYAAQIWINGELVANHEIGHLPILAEISSFLHFGKENLITVACDNTLLSDTIPQGYVTELPNGRLVQSYSFDFFNYAGIDRSVLIYTTPKTYIEDITLFTDYEDTTGYVDYNITVVSPDEEDDTNNFTISVSLADHRGEIVAVSTQSSTNGSLAIKNVSLWWPYLMHPSPGYQYTFSVELLDEDKSLIDRYYMKVGIRTLYWTNTSYYINDKPIYFHGFGRHEDSDFRGKGFDWALVTRDHNLIKWVGANAYRTSHYPYAEEILDTAEELGIMIIDECPSVNTDLFTEELLVKHKKSLSELIQRDKNRAAVVLWSAANEPMTKAVRARDYFRRVIDHIKSLDDSRPTTIVVAQGSNVDQSSLFVDIVSFNRYNAWYSQGGNLDVITDSVINEATSWFNAFGKPVIMQEYGADTLEGLHFLPEYIWSEEYQVKLMSKHFKAFDELRSRGFFIGEFIWNFADFKTAQTYTRVGGNKKGIFTRNRQPKAGAFHLRRRYWSLARELYNSTQPDDLQEYVSRARDEL